MGDYPLGYQRGYDEQLGSPLRFFRGTETGLKSLTDLEDGRLLFATDSKKIYLDCDFVTGEGTPVQKRIPFGGSTAVLYGAKQFSEADIEQGNFSFGLEYIENIEELPDVDSLILNTLDGSFYRVTGLTEDGTEVVAERLSVSGSGGSGGSGGAGYIVGKIVNGATKFFTQKEATYPIQFSAMSSIEGAIMYAKIYINNVLAANIESGLVQSMTETNTIDLKKYVANLGESFLINDVNKVSLVLTDDYDNTKTLKYDVTVFNLYVAPSTQSIPVQYGSFLYQCRPYGGVGLQNRQLTFEIRNVGEENIIWNYTMSLQNQQDGAPVNITIPFQTHGTYNLSIYISGVIPQTGALLTSEALVQQIMFYENGQSAPLISISALDNYLYEQYDYITVNYMIAYGATTHSEVELIVEIDEGSGRTVHSRTSATVENNKMQAWDVTFSKAGYYYLTVKIKDSEYAQVAPMFTVTAFSDDVPTVDETHSALELYLSANGRSNDETDRNSWEYNGIKSSFVGFNWQSNGWKTDSEGVTSLHLDNGAQLIIPFSPFPTNGNATTYGKTIELDFKISNVRKAGAELITCYSTNRDDEPSSSAVTGFVITESQSALNSKSLKTIGETASSASNNEKGLIATFKQDERMHITYAINSLNDDPAGMVYTYVNGVVSGLVRYSEGDTFADATNRPSQFVFKSDDADIDIYNIRVYAQSLDGRIVLYNYIADQGTAEEKVANWDDNDVLDANTQEVSLTKVKQAGNIPYMVFEDGRKSDKKGVITAGATVGALPTGKKDYRYCNVYYVDPEHPDKNFPQEENTTVPMVIYGQGTSSMSYPVKNLRIKFLDDTTYSLLNGEYGDITPVNLFCLKADYMESSSAHNTGTGNTLFELYDSIGMYTPAQLTYGLNSYLTAIVGHPIVCFFKAYDATGKSTYQFIGRYNFNLDKATPEPFGFFEDADQHYGVRLEEYPDWDENYKEEALKKTVKGGFDHTLDAEPDADKTYYTAPDLSAVWNGTKEQFKDYITKTGCLYEYSDAARAIQCWEFLDNGQALCGMRVPWDEATDAKTLDKKNQPYPVWRSSFECRYPEPEDQVCADKRAMSRVISWLVSTNQNLATNEKITDESEWLTVVDNGATIVYDTDTKEYRLLKFKQQFYDYFRMDYTAFYYVLTEVLCMMDSRAKNMMFCTFDADPDANTGHWFPIFYDMDTMLGVNNSGVLEFDYNVEDYGDQQVYNGSSDYNHLTYSVLWCNFREAFGTEIRDMYNNLRRSGKLTYNNLIDLYNKSQANEWNETYINKDAYYKYIRPLYEAWWDDNEEKFVGGENGGIDYLYVGQGTRSEHRSYWLYNRLNYLDTKYEYMRSIEAQPDVDFRTNTPAGQTTSDQTDSSVAALYAKSLAAVPSDLSFQLTSLVDQFAMMKYSQTETAPVKVLAGETITINPPENLTANDTETFIQAAGNYTDFGNLANKYVSKFFFNSQVKIRNLKLGDEHPDYYNPKLSSLGAFATQAPFLENLDVQNCMNLSGTLDLSPCSYIQTIKAKGTQYTNIIFPVGGNLKQVILPSTINTLKILNHLYFDTINHPENLTFESYDSLNYLWIQDCPLVDTKAIINNASRLTNVRLMDINWTFDATEDFVIDEESKLITGIKLLDKLIYTGDDPNLIIHGIDANGNNIGREGTGNQYLAGTITIKNGTVGVSDMDLYEKYNKYFPNIKFVYDSNSNNVQAYTVHIRDAQKQTQYLYLTKLMATADAVTAFNDGLEAWFADSSKTPMLKKTPSVKYKYEFLGWNTTGPRDFEEADVAQADSILAFKVIENDDGSRTVTRMNGFTLTTSSFENMEFSFYPTYAAIIQDYTVTFYRDATHTDILKQEKVKYGNDATPPPEPFILRLPETENADGSPDDNVKLCYCKPFSKYSIGYTNVVGNVDTHAEYGEEVEFKTLPSDVSYFTIDKYSMSDGTWELILNEGFQEEAIVVPSVVEGNAIGAVSINRENALKLRRIYFAANSQVSKITFTNMYYEIKDTMEADVIEEYNKRMATLEYIDFTAVGNLAYLAGINGLRDNINLYVPDILPHSIQQIDNYYFAGDPYLNITALPGSLKTLGSGVFQDCVGITEINLNESIPLELKALSTRTFSGCTNLTLSGNNIAGNATAALTTVGDRAFQECHNLQLDFDGGNSTITEIGTRAFYTCPKARFTDLPHALVTIGDSAFRSPGNTCNMDLSYIPDTVTSIAANAFGDRISTQPYLFLACKNATSINANAFTGYTIDGIVLPSGVSTSASPWNTAPWGAKKSTGEAADVLTEEDIG